MRIKLSSHKTTLVVLHPSGDLKYITTQNSIVEGLRRPTYFKENKDVINFITGKEYLSKISSSSTTSALCTYTPSGVETENIPFYDLDWDSEIV